jgi:steroid 5-alpha reductase family enzyme
MLVSAGSLLALMLLAWLLSLALHDVSIVDVVWGLGFVVVAWIGVALGSDCFRRLLVAALVSLWGLRLAGYIGRRKLRDRREDPRYAAWRERHGASFPLVSLMNVFLFQGLLVWVVSLPVQAASQSTAGLSWLDIVGVVVWGVGVFFEAVGDTQLARFKGDSANRGKVMDRGLWRYTRHPNYFGDFCVWWGLYLIALAGGAWWSIVGPLVMTTLLTRVSGKDHLEKTMSKRPGYAEYVQRTSGFFPRPPKT